MVQQSVNVHLVELLNRFPELESAAVAIQGVVDRICSAYNAGGKILICGNGGSASDSEHIVGELMKGFVLPRVLSDDTCRRFEESNLPNAAHLAQRLQRGIPAIAISGHSSLATAISNDIDASMVFAQQVYVLGQPHDVFIGISTSGNSTNVVNAASVAHIQGLCTIGMTGSAESRLDELCDIIIKAPSSNTHRVQEYHLPIYHTICLMVEERLFGI